MKITPLIICISLLCSCNTKEELSEEVSSNEQSETIKNDHIVINASINNANGVMYYLYNLGAQQPQILDSITVTNNQAEFDVTPKDNHTILGLGSSQKNLMLFIGQKQDSISITANHSDAFADFNIEGSESSLILKQYFFDRLNIINQLNETQNKLQALPFEKQIERENLILESQVIKNAFNKLKTDFILNNKNSPAIFLALYDISDPVTEYDMLEVIAESISNNFSNTVFQQQAIMRINKAKQQIAMIEQQSAMQEQQKNAMKNAGLFVGGNAPELTYSGVNGESISLSSLKGKVVLLDFWASWCGPCRKENPFVVNLYNKYKNRGFDIYSFSLDNNKEKWIQAINQDQLSWKNHVSDLKGWQSAGAAKYMIKSIPQTFIIDRKGKIAEIGLRGAELEQKILELL
ncbi:MAG: TlpA family protein disulfide reductase [Parvicellaceae bacterium]